MKLYNDNNKNVWNEKKSFLLLFIKCYLLSLVTLSIIHKTHFKK